jgi:phosphoenolpyruvate-protein phosphotransferase (PTS system enzyme I)
LVKRLIRAARAPDGTKLVERIMLLTAADEIERVVRDEMKQLFGPLLEDEEGVEPVAG